MRRSAIRVGAFLVAGALVGAPPASAADPAHKVITPSLTSTGAHKECLSLAKSPRLRYWFRADGPLDFNIQVRVGKAVRYPVRRDNVEMDAGSFAPDVPDVHCMVLTNIAGRPVTVRLEFARVNE